MSAQDQRPQEEIDREHAEMYRWLRQNRAYVIRVQGETIHCGGHFPIRADKFGPALDAAVREGMAKTPSAETKEQP